jgi:hypothetical protein
MNPPKVDELDCIQFLIAAQRVFTCTEAAGCRPEPVDPPAHDAFSRLLSRQPPDTVTLWQGVRRWSSPRKAILLPHPPLEDAKEGRKTKPLEPKGVRRVRTARASPAFCGQGYEAGTCTPDLAHSVSRRVQEGAKSGARALRSHRRGRGFESPQVHFPSSPHPPGAHPGAPACSPLASGLTPAVSSNSHLLVAAHPRSLMSL